MHFSLSLWVCSNFTIFCRSNPPISTFQISELCTQNFGIPDCQERSKLSENVRFRLMRFANRDICQEQFSSTFPPKCTGNRSRLASACTCLHPLSNWTHCFSLDNKLLELELLAKPLKVQEISKIELRRRITDTKVSWISVQRRYSIFYEWLNYSW